jgi:O-antigen/teichoic acid export membrane protein
MSVAEIKNEAYRSAKWALLSNLLPRLVTPILLIILGRLLLPEDYGVVSIASLILALLTLFQQSGLLPAIVQRKEMVEESANQAFWLSLGFAGLIYIMIWFLAPVVASIYAEPRVTPVLRVLSLQLFISSFAMPQQALLTRDLRFKKLFWVQLFTSLAPYAISIPLALFKFGYWALAAGMLTGSLVNVILMWSQGRWRPRFTFNLGLMTRLFNFGKFVLMESLLGWLLVYFDNAVVGKVLGVKALGVYALGFQLATLAIAIPISAVTGIALPLFSRLQNNPSELRDAYLNGTRMIAYYGIPAGVGLFLVAELLVKVIYGQKWEGLGMTLSILAIYTGFSYLFTLNSDAFRAIGRPDVTPKLYLIIVPYMLLVFTLSAPYGLYVFCWARATVVLFSAPLHAFFAIKYLDLPKAYLLDVLKNPLIATGGMAMVIILFRNLLWHYSDLIILVCLLVAGILTYASILFLIDNRARFYLKALVERNL